MYRCGRLDPRALDVNSRSVGLEAFLGHRHHHHPPLALYFWPRVAVDIWNEDSSNHFEPNILSGATLTYAGHPLVREYPDRYSFNLTTYSPLAERCPAEQAPCARLPQQLWTLCDTCPFFCMHHKTVCCTSIVSRGFGIPVLRLCYLSQASPE